MRVYLSPPPSQNHGARSAIIVWWVHCLALYLNQRINRRINLKIWTHYNIYEVKIWHLSTNTDQLDWRRSKVVEMRARLGLCRDGKAVAGIKSFHWFWCAISTWAGQRNRPMNSSPIIYLNNISYVLTHWIQYSSMHLKPWKPPEITGKICTQGNYSNIHIWSSWNCCHQILQP